MKGNWNYSEPGKHVTKTGLVYYVGKLMPKPFEPPKDPLTLLGEQLFDRCEELGIELTMQESVAIREGMVMVSWDNDANEAQLLPPWIPTCALAREIERRQKARG